MGGKVIAYNTLNSAVRLILKACLWAKSSYWGQLDLISGSLEQCAQQAFIAQTSTLRSGKYLNPCTELSASGKSGTKGQLLVQCAKCKTRYAVTQSARIRDGTRKARGVAIDYSRPVWSPCCFCSQNTHPLNINVNSSAKFTPLLSKQHLDQTVS